jgi:DNA-binding NarL/FixJ family response regulator
MFCTFRPFVENGCGELSDGGMRNGSQKNRVLLVDDHPMVCAGMASVIEREPDIVVCGQAHSAAEALSLMAKTLPNVAVLDLSLGTGIGGGLDLIKDVRAQFHAIRVLVVSMHTDAQCVNRALQAGALGYVAKEEAVGSLVAGIRTVLSDRRYLAVRLDNAEAALFDATYESRSQVDELSDRELAVFELLGQGREIGAIAKAMHVSVSTIHTYCGRTKQKLLVQTERDLLVAAVRWAEQKRLRS